MLCALSQRRLVPGSFDEFRAAWKPDRYPDGFVRIYHLRNATDENDVISFGLFDGTREQLADAVAATDEGDRQERMRRCVESTSVDAVFEVAEEIDVAAAS
jgi:hypothetical protein